LILAAGMGSRYGGLKQLDSFGPNGETIIDYSIYDAILAGFEKIVFIIRKSFEQEFRARMEERWRNKIEMDYVYQELTDLPEGYLCPIEREKPWGTGHALWAAREAIHEPFGVINADDYYGREAIQVLYNYLKENQGEKDFAVVAYELMNTLSEHGAVNRGVCKADDTGQLIQVEEWRGIARNKKGQICAKSENGFEFFGENTLVSMNMWAFQHSYFAWAEDYFRKFLSKRIEENGSEFYIPELIQDLIERKELSVDILSSPSHWFGVTYKEDKPFVQAEFENMIQSNFYPKNLTNESMG